MVKRGLVFLLVILILILITVNYYWMDSFIVKTFNESESGIVTRIVDGDTVIIGNQSVRLLGINTPERGEKYYSEAKNYTEAILFNKNVTLEFGKERYDLYKRELAYIYLNDELFNIQLIEKGYANVYFPSGKDKYYDDFLSSWYDCMNKSINFCKKSQDYCSQCIILRELDVKKQTIAFYNKCDFNCSLNGWTIKDEGRKKFTFRNFMLNPGEGLKIIVGNKTNSDNTLYWRGEDYVWTKTGDSLFLRDERNDLILFNNY